MFGFYAVIRILGACGLFPSNYNALLGGGSVKVETCLCKKFTDCAQKVQCMSRFIAREQSWYDRRSTGSFVRGMCT